MDYFFLKFKTVCNFQSWKIIVSCYVAVIAQMKGYCSANLTFRALGIQADFVGVDLIPSDMVDSNLDILVKIINFFISI